MKRINLNEEHKQDLIKKFTEYINKAKFTDNTLNFTTKIDNCLNTKTVTRPTVYFSSIAYLKMMLYIRDTDSEIAWHGTVEKNAEQNWYLIKDVFLYPQILSAVTVNTDQEKYQEWLQNIENDDIFNNIRFQGHSHVNMGVTPSSTDLNMYNNFLQVLPKNDYYIFVIMDKSGAITCLIYDLEKNIIYESQDIDVKILAGESYDVLEDIKKEKEKYCTKPAYNYNHTPWWHEQTPSREYDNYLLQQSDPNAQTASYIDRMFDEIDAKYKNPTIISKKSKPKKGAKK